MRLGSWCYWRAYFPEYWIDDTETTGEVCPLCDGVGYVMVKDVQFYCICLVKSWEAKVQQSIEPYRSWVEPASLDDLVTTNKQRNVDALISGIEVSKLWALRPLGYLVLAGPFGVGKSHILRSLNVMLHPIALYITASEFNRGVHHARGEDTVSQYITAVSRAPVLLFDDWGMEYSAPFVDSQFAHVVDTRDRDINAFPMALATNKGIKQIMSVPRVGSRVMNVDKTQVIMLDMNDYRVSQER